MKQLQTAIRLSKFSLETLTVTRSIHCQNKMVPQKVSKRRAEPTPWPPRSPDLTPCDFCSWGYVKDQYHSPSESEFHRPWPKPVSPGCGVHGKNSNIICRIINPTRLDKLYEFPCCFKVFHFCGCNRFEITQFSYHPNHIQQPCTAF
jgi:hypothetical protein